MVVATERHRYNTKHKYISLTKYYLNRARIHIKVYSKIYILTHNTSWYVCCQNK